MKELEIIRQLMEKLEQEMSHDVDDFDSRLGRKKPDVEIMKVSRDLPLEKEEEYGEDLGEEDLEMEPEEQGMLGGEEDDLMRRISKLRGK